MIEFNSHVFEGNAQFSDGGSVVFHVISDTPLVRVSGFVKFGGSITVDASHLPKNISNTTLMTFNSSIGRFDPVRIDSQLCSPGVHYLANSLVLDFKINNDDCQKDPISFLWVLWVSIGLFILTVAVILVIYIVKKLGIKTKTKTNYYKSW